MVITQLLYVLAFLYYYTFVFCLKPCVQQLKWIVEVSLIRQRMCHFDKQRFCLHSSVKLASFY